MNRFYKPMTVLLFGMGLQLIVLGSVPKFREIPLSALILYTCGAGIAGGVGAEFSRQMKEKFND
jgi:hypothetical protein